LSSNRPQPFEKEVCVLFEDVSDEAFIRFALSFEEFHVIVPFIAIEKSQPFEIPDFIEGFFSIAGPEIHVFQVVVGRPFDNGEHHPLAQGIDLMVQGKESKPVMESPFFDYGYNVSHFNTF
jgi:hypothetical protein